MISYQDILDYLKSIEDERKIKIIYACLAGSQAFGYAGPESDTDIRFIYVHPLDKYLSINEPSETLEIERYSGIDIMGWELKKTIKLAMKSNQHIFEWLVSPVVFININDFQSKMFEICKAYFNPIKVRRAYVSIFRNKAKEEEHLKTLVSGAHALGISAAIMRTGDFPDNIEIGSLVADMVEGIPFGKLIEARKNGCSVITQGREEAFLKLHEWAALAWGDETREEENTHNSLPFNPEQCDQVFRSYLS